MFRDYVKKLKGIAGEERTTNILSKSIFLVTAGSVDFAAYFAVGARKAQYDIPSYADLVVGYASEFVQVHLRVYIKSAPSCNYINLHAS